jgi:hypothetical protein
MRRTLARHGGIVAQHYNLVFGHIFSIESRFLQNRTNKEHSQAPGCIAASYPAKNRDFPCNLWL